MTSLCKSLGITIHKRYVNVKGPNLWERDISKQKPLTNLAEQQNAYNPNPNPRGRIRIFNPPPFPGELQTSKISKVEKEDSKKKAVLFISTQVSKYIIAIDNKIKDRYFIVLDNFLSNNDTFKEILKDYMEITVILHVEALKIKDKSYHCYGRNNNITAEGLLECVLAVNKKAKYTILASSCFGFYYHEYAKMLPLGSVLITFSDYASNTLCIEHFFIYFSNSENREDINSFLLYYMSQSLIFIPCIFVSYIKKYDSINISQLRITSIFHYISTRYQANVFYSVRNMEQLANAMAKYCTNERYNKSTFHEWFYKGELDNKFIKKKLCKLPENNPQCYTDPYAIVKEINDHIHKKQPVGSYFSRIYKYTKITRYSHFSSACNYTWTEEIKEMLHKAIILRKDFYLLNNEIIDEK
jgi:hypothetical protein